MRDLLGNAALNNIILQISAGFDDEAQARSVRARRTVRPRLAELINMRHPLGPNRLDRLACDRAHFQRPLLFGARATFIACTAHRQLAVPVGQNPGDSSSLTCKRRIGEAGAGTMATIDVDCSVHMGVPVEISEDMQGVLVALVVLALSRRSPGHVSSLRRGSSPFKPPSGRLFHACCEVPRGRNRTGTPSIDRGTTMNRKPIGSLPGGHLESTHRVPDR